MTNETRKRLAETLRHLVELVSPLLLLIVIYFVKPIFDAVPKMVTQQELISERQQTHIQKIVEVGNKQGELERQMIDVGSKVNVLSEKVTQLERKVDF